MSTKKVIILMAIFLLIYLAGMIVASLPKEGDILIIKTIVSFMIGSAFCPIAFLVGDMFRREKDE